MTSLNKSTLRAPMIGKIYALDDYLDRVAILPSKRMQRVVVEPMLIQVSLLHTQAMRELRGLDYYKRIKDILLELQAAEYKTQKRIVQTVLNSEYSKWIYFEEEPHHFICKMRKEFSQAAMSAKDIQEIENNLKESIYDCNAN